MALFLSEVQYIQLREVSDTKKIVPDFFYYTIFDKTILTQSIHASIIF